MKNTLRQLFRSPRFVTGFALFAIILLTMIIYPLINPGNPLKQIGKGSFIKPGNYVSVYDAIDTQAKVFELPDAQENRIASRLTPEDREAIVKWFELAQIPVENLDINDTDTLLALWKEHYNPDLRISGMIKAQRNYYIRLNNSIAQMGGKDSKIIAEKNEETGELTQSQTVSDTSYVSVDDVANTISLPLGTDNFGRDMLKQLVAACGVSIRIGLIAGAIATFIGLLFGLLAGYLGGWVDDAIMFITNIFTVIPGFILLILISYSIGQEQRGATTVAMVIGLTSWVWTARSVRSQVISLRNRDHVNLSRLSGHNLFHIIIADILPYIASYVVMAFVLQVSSAILAEAQLSLLGLGPKTTEVPTLGIMMNWAMFYAAPSHNYWWAYFPVVLTIAGISFSLNLMNTGMDQVFNPTLRD